ncbi:MAG: hypothetical protein K2J00_03525 [Bacteroidaceae bacterium]|nr:hypothetical protein [Bacteroidaceae bacterium]
MKKHLLLAYILIIPALCLNAQERFDELLSVLRRDYSGNLQEKEKVMRTSGNSVYANTVILELGNTTTGKMASVVRCLDRMLPHAPESNRYRRDDTLTYTMIWRETLKGNPQLPKCYHFPNGGDMARDLSVRSFLIYQQYGRRVKLVCHQSDYLDKEIAESPATLEGIDSLVAQIARGKDVKNIPVRYSRNMSISWLSVGNECDISCGNIYELPASERNRMLYRELYDMAKKIAARKQAHLDLVERGNTAYFQASYRQGLGLRLLPDGRLLVMRIDSEGSIAFPYDWYKYKSVSPSGLERLDTGAN